MNDIPLSPVDYLFTGVASQPITFAFSYANRLDPASLEKSLGETFRHFPILRSTLVKTSETDYAYRVSDKGSTFEVAESDVSMNTSMDIGQFITPVESTEGNPLTKIALTRTPGGSVLAVSISHALVDGFSYFHFFSSWARTCRGDRILDPGMEREGLLKALTGGGEAVTPRKLYDDCGLFLGGKRGSMRNDPGPEERFFVSKDAIRSQLEAANREPSRVPLSENDLLTAFLWKKYLPSWTSGDGNPETFATCPVDFRRVVKSISKTYLGCALCFASASLDRKSLLDASVEDVAVRINRAVRGINADHVLRSLQTLEDLRRQKGLAALEDVHLRNPENGLIVTNLTRLPVRDLDFGSGAPADFLIYIDVRGGAALLPAENGIEVVVSHPSAGD